MQVNAIRLEIIFSSNKHKREERERERKRELNYNGDNNDQHKVVK